MGARNLTCIVDKGKYIVAKYCQWDGYPSGNGLELLHLLQEVDLSKIRKNLNKITEFDRELYEDKLIELGATDEMLQSGFVNFKIINTYNEKYPYHSRDVGPGILKYIEEATEEFSLINDLDFAGDSLFCEWCYVIDFDKNTFEVYKGFNNKPLEKTERFYFLENSDTEYYPVKLVALYPLDKLPSDEWFLKDTEETEEDE